MAFAQKPPVSSLGRVAHEEWAKTRYGENWREVEAKAEETRRKIAATKAYRRQWGQPGYVCIVRWQSEGDAYYNAHLETMLGDLPNQDYEVVRRIWYGRTDKTLKKIEERFERYGVSSNGMGFCLSKSGLIYILELTEDERPPDQPKPEQPKSSPVDEPKPFSVKGYVYVLKAPMTPGNWFKIGRTRNPRNRLATFNVKLPFPVEYEHLIKTDDMYTLEAELHQRYRHRRGDGEWFALTATDLEQIKEGQTQ